MKWPAWASFPGPGLHVWNAAEVVVQNCIGLRFTGDNVTLVDHEDGTCEVQFTGEGGIPTLAQVVDQGNDLAGRRIVGAGDPEGDQDYATKHYVDESGGGGASLPQPSPRVVRLTAQNNTDDGQFIFSAVDELPGNFSIVDGNLVAGAGDGGLYQIAITRLVVVTPPDDPSGVTYSVELYPFGDFGDRQDLEGDDIAPAEDGSLDPGFLTAAMSLYKGEQVEFDFWSDNMPDGQSAVLAVDLTLTRVSVSTLPIGGSNRNVLARIGADDTAAAGIWPSDDPRSGEELGDTQWLPVASLFPDAPDSGYVWQSQGASPANPNWVLPTPPAPPAILAALRAYSYGAGEVNVTGSSPTVVGCGGLTTAGLPAPGWSQVSDTLTFDHTKLPADGTNGAGIFEVSISLFIEDNGSGAPPLAIDIDPGITGPSAPSDVLRRTALVWASNQSRATYSAQFILGDLSASDVLVQPIVTLIGGTTPNVNVLVESLYITRISK